MEAASKKTSVRANGVQGTERQHEALYIFKEILYSPHNNLQRAGNKGINRY